jgi:hypothetical protein
MTSSSASDHGNPGGIAALMQKGSTSKGMEANKNFAKWLSCGIQISGTLGLHHVYIYIYMKITQIEKLDIINFHATNMQYINLLPNNFTS